MTTSSRGYGTPHQRLRRRLLPTAYGTPCHYCGELMEYGQPLDLDHTDDRAGWVGMAHASCNRAAGARKARRGGQTPTDPDPNPPATQW